MENRDLRVANSLSEFEKVVFVQIKVNSVSGRCHTIGRNIEEQYLHRRRKRNQKHDNKATYSNPCSKDIHPHGKRAHHQTGMRYRERPLFPTPEKYLHLVSKISQYKADRTPYTKQ